MPYAKPIETDTLELPSDPSYTVTMKRRASFGDQRRAQAAMIRVDGATGTMSDPEWDAYVGSLLASLIVSWNLTDENDQPMPITPENIDRLAPEDGQFLATEVAKRAALRSEAQQRPFGKPSSPPSTEAT